LSIVTCPLPDEHRCGRGALKASAPRAHALVQRTASLVQPRCCWFQRDWPVVHQQSSKFNAYAMLAGQVALVTGGARGIGRATAEVLLRQGCKVALVDFRREDGEQAAAELQSTARGNGGVCEFFQCRVDAPDELEQTFAAVELELGSLDIVLNNAGIANMLNEGLKNWQGQLAVNVGGVIQGTELARDSFRASGKGGVIINTASLVGLKPDPAMPVYSATKWAVLGFTRGVQYWREQEPPIRVAAVCPALVLTEGGLASLVATKEAGLPATHDPGIPPSDIADAVLSMIAGALADEAVVVVGPTGAHPDRLYNQHQAQAYGATGILYDDKARL
jgi:15-hydroxyprostaglandin dehydrogenase (NAD)